MSNEKIVEEHRKLENLLKAAISKIIDIWCAGEGDLTLEIRDADGDKTAKIKGGHTVRIK